MTTCLATFETPRRPKRRGKISRRFPLSHIRDAKTPKEVWENLKKIFAANTSARKLQLRQELNNTQQKDMSVSDYTAKIKSICDSLGSNNVNIDDDEMVQICLGGLAPRFGAM